MRPGFAWYFLSLKGRVSRQEYWLGYGMMIAVVFPLRWTLEALSLRAFRPPGRGWWYGDELDAALALPKFALPAILLWPLTAILVKRVHDLNLSAWWLLALAAFPMAGASTTAGRVAFWTCILIAGLIPGTRGSNRFGADPIGHTRT